MRRFITLMACVSLVGSCGGGGGSGAGGTPGGVSGARGFLGDTADFVGFLKSDRPATPLDPSNVPSQPVTLNGGAGGRLGWTNRALLGAAHMDVDFAAGFVSGRIDQVGLYSVSPDLPLIQTTPRLSSEMTGQFTFSGTIPATDAAAPNPGFIVRYGGVVSGETEQEPVQFTLDAVTNRGAFYLQDGVLYGLGQMDGVVVRRHPGGHAIEETLREGVIYVGGTP